MVIERKQNTRLKTAFEVAKVALPFAAIVGGLAVFSLASQDLTSTIHAMSKTVSVSTGINGNGSVNVPVYINDFPTYFQNINRDAQVMTISGLVSGLGTATAVSQLIGLKNEMKIEDLEKQIAQLTETPANS